MANIIELLSTPSVGLTRKQLLIHSCSVVTLVHLDIFIERSLSLNPIPVLLCITAAVERESSSDFICKVRQK